MKPYSECKKSLWKDEHTCHHFLPATANPPKSDGKYAQKSVQLVRGSSLRNELLLNPYFSKTLLFLRLKADNSVDINCSSDQTSNPETMNPKFSSHENEFAEFKGLQIRLF